MHELEKQLVYPFFKREWELLSEGRERSRYWRLTEVEWGLPIIFIILFCALIVYAFLG